MEAIAKSSRSLKFLSLSTDAKNSLRVGSATISKAFRMTIQKLASDFERGNSIHREIENRKQEVFMKMAKEGFIHRIF